jgi:hypothetical protein
MFIGSFALCDQIVALNGSTLALFHAAASRVAGRHRTGGLSGTSRRGGFRRGLAALLTAVAELLGLM